MLNCTLKYNRKVPIITGKVLSAPIDMLFDTGAEVSVIDSKLGLSLINAGILIPAGVKSVIGTPIGKQEQPWYILPKLCIDSITIINLPVIMSDLRGLKVYMILGSYVLRNNMFTISYAAKSMMIDDSITEIKVELGRDKETGKPYSYVPLNILGE